MTTKKEHVAVLMTCFNRRESTLQCLKKLFKNNKVENTVLKVYLVDDGSTDGTFDAVKINYPDVKLIKGTGNLYWNRGMCLAWQKALEDIDHDFYIWLNDDVDLVSNAVEILIESSRAKADSIICGPTNSNGTNITTYGAERDNGTLMHPTGSLEPCFHSFNGNVVLIPRAVFNILGTLDKKFVHSIGDYDYAFRARKKNITIFLAPQYLGSCEKHTKPPIWCRKEVVFRERIRSLYSPLGNSHPYYFFIFEARHKSILTAIIHFFSIHLRVMFPILWSQK